MAFLFFAIGSPLTSELLSPKLLGPVEIRSLAATLDIRPTKTLGQNFVHDGNTVRKIVSTAQLTPHDRVLEVGPGLGSLTLGLLGACASVVAVEIDPKLSAQLPLTVSQQAADYSERLTVVTGDALRVTQNEILQQPTALVANLPYNVAVPVLLHLLAEMPSIATVLVMVQLEVAQRLAASPGNKVYGVPSVKSCYYGTVSLAGTIGKQVFWPEPNVESGLVKIVRHQNPEWEISTTTRERVFPVIDAAFAQRRKTLRSALAGWAGSPVEAERRLRAADIDPSLRGERLDIADFIRLSATVD